MTTTWRQSDIGGGRAPSSGRIIDMTIETLLGTSYEVKVSNKTNVGFLKAKLQRTEGIPQQCLHLVHRYVQDTILIPIG